MKILITGGAGYIGSHVNRYLNALGVETVVLDNLSRGHRRSLLWGEFVEGSCGDKELVTALLEAGRFDLVMHFAAYAYVGESVGQPGLYYSNNVAQTLNLLEAMRTVGLDKIVFSSTCATFGTAKYLPIDEVHPQEPVNPYGKSKLIVENMLEDFGRAFGLKSCVFRYFNAAGCDPSGVLFENHQPETHVIPLLIRSASQGKRFEIMGTDYETSDGTCIRDYVHVNDLASAHWLGARWLLDGGESQSFNLANGSGVSVRDLVKAVGDVVGSKPNVVEVDRRPGDPPELVGSSAKIEKLLGWTREYTDIHRIVETAWNAERKMVSAQ